MAAIQGRAVYDFEAGDSSELTIYTSDILTILRQDIGDGWWEARNTRGQQGLVPEAYIEITSVPEPSIPPPPPPAFGAAFAPPPPAAPTPAVPSYQPPPQTNRLSQQNSWNGPPPKPVAPPSDNGWGQPPPPAQSYPRTTNAAATKQDSYEDWDDDDWDDDDSSTTTEVPSEFGSSNQGVRERTGSSSDDKHKFGGTVSKRFGRFSNFAKQGGEAYLFDRSTPNLSTDKMVQVMETSDGPCWKRVNDPFTCTITSPKKESKFGGIKKFIAYQLTPTFSNIQVSRRYKHFDWLHDRLVEKYPCCAVPPLPEKQVAGRFEEDFITTRLRQLQLWIDRMCIHPIIAQSDVIMHFMCCTDEKKWKAGKRRAEKDEYQGVKFFLTVQTPNEPLDAKTTENQIDRFGRFVKSMDDSVRHLTNIGEHNVKKHQGPFKKEFCKIGGSFIALAKSFEYDERPEAQPLTQAIEHTGRTYEEIGSLFERQPAHDMSDLLEGLHEYKGLLSTFPDAISVHRESEKTYKATMVAMAATNKIQESAGKFSEAEMTSVQAKADVIAYSVMAEMNHFQNYRVGDFKNHMQSYIRGQIQFYKQIVQKLETSLQQYDSA